MKKNLRWMFIQQTCIAVAFTFCIQSSYSQTLWGMTSDGGSKKTGGNIFSISEDGTGFTERYAFLHDGNDPLRAGLIDYGDGYFYGVAIDRIFRLHSDGSGYEIVYILDESIQIPNKLLKGLDGFLYASTMFGGAHDHGMIYKVKNDGSSFQDLHDFNGTDGDQPFGELIQLSSGVLYGVTAYGGNSGFGTIFSINADGSAFQSLKSFNGTNGSRPDGGLTSITINSVDYLYGIAAEGGANNKGAIFRIRPDGTNYSRQFDFSNSSGKSPSGPLLKLGNAFYGVTSGGGTYDGGTAFQYDPFGDNYQTLHQFPLNTFSNSLGPIAPLINVNGVLYGETMDDHNGYGGYIFKLNVDGSGYQELHDFNDRLDNWSNLLFVNNQLFGLTTAGYNSSTQIIWSGTVYKMNPDGSSFQTIHDFTATNGYGPSASLIRGQDGKLYGTTQFGGSTGDGVLFSIETSGNNYAVKSTLGTDHKGGPQGSIIQTSSGYFCGMISNAENFFPGKIFSLAMNSVFTVYAEYTPFCDGSGCSYAPIGSLLQASDGKLYGMTPSTSESNDNGTIFRIAVDGTGFTILKTFNGSNGSKPDGSLIQGSDGYLYGMTENGGSNDFGVIFKIKTDGTGYQKLFEFGSSLYGDYGTHPKGSLLLGSDGKLYGVTQGGGSGWAGTIFQINTDGTGFSVIFNFNSSSSGALPDGSLIEDVSNGYLFGMTEQGGFANAGTVFKVKKDGTGFQSLFQFDGYTGKYPKGDLLLVPYTIHVSGPPVLTSAAQKNSVAESNTNSHISIYPNPVIHSFTIRFPNSFSGDAEYSLADLTGKILLKQTINHSSFAEMKSVDISFVPPGTYLLEITTPKEKFAQKIVKQ